MALFGPLVLMNIKPSIGFKYQILIKVFFTHFLKFGMCVAICLYFLMRIGSLIPDQGPQIS